MSRFKLALIIGWLVIAAINSNAVNFDNAALWRPRFATPAIVALDNPADRQFTSEIKASPSVRDWKASIANDLKTWPCQIVSATYATIDNGTKPGWQLKISVPADTSPELFALTVACNESVSVQPQSVSVVPAFETNFYILHITDEQIVNRLHTDPSGQYYKYQVLCRGGHRAGQTRKDWVTKIQRERENEKHPAGISGGRPDCRRDPCRWPAGIKG
ncbi:MAG TPA: hypothetical protein VG077_13565 [Verrucomicrobiae bacterium]|nr:hypothetical protein [Verrucomicrobiae bacterium]